ncbi:hypothetical protein S7711_07474 [Stachybotrys chartarum IBT 7711]|uniref:C3HC-type domain-containing protein n=1 Tax=Stachybotrys chartarum (strain CBS 109288 / IBT 7711) TaxID=1280523 RepID=A0A084AFQ0_STACB|nr:hypothetical protein S7711_07474 [Stachybotrys chartarum IBT 7711]KFA50884.1 hypothetical protein S40293_02496 [Stachybotrys chartarum IBT 40293]
MNATKRKFNALLQGLSTQPQAERSTPTKASSTPPSTLSKSAYADDLLKRRRLGPASDTSPSRLPTTTLKAAQTTSKTESSGNNQGPLVKYCPSDREELLRRLATFQEITEWTPKPDKVSEIEWAKKGWVCQGKERVRCVLCARELVVKLNRKELEDGKEANVLASSEIGARTPWWKNHLIRLSFSSPKLNLEALRQRYNELCSRKDFLPYEVNLRLPEGLRLDQVLAQLPPGFFEQSSNSASVPSLPNHSRVALALALFGWQGLSNNRIGAVPNSASCHTCLRRLGLWMFKSKEVDDAGKVLVPAPMDHLDPVREHRFFCPWKNAHTQHGAQAQHGQAGAAPGWAILAQTLQNDAHLRNIYEGQSSTRVRSKESRHPDKNIRDNSTPAKTSHKSSASNASDADYTAVPASNILEEVTDNPEDEKERESKDKERWARLRRVKSLFDPKGSRRLKRPASQPGARQPGASMGASSGLQEGG